MTLSSANSRARTGDGFFKDSLKKKVKAKKKDLAPAIFVGEHGRYQIKSGRLGGNFVARAFPKPPTKARGMIAEATGESEEAAVAALRDFIDAREKRQTGERRRDAGTIVSVPSTDEFIEAIRQVALTRPQFAILKALSLAGAGGLTEASMASSAGYKSFLSASRSFAGAGLLIADYLSIDTSSKFAKDDPDGTSVLGYRGNSKDENDPGNWILHEELSHAVRACM